MPKRWSTVSRPDAPSHHGGRFGAIAATALLLLLALVLLACSTPSTAPAAGPNGVALLSSAAVSATIGPAGGELTTSDPDRGRSYRLSIPAGALREDTEVTMTPIAAIENFPFEGGLLGGVELEPSGTKLLGPASLTVSLDAERQAELRSGLEGDQVVLGFNYPGDTANAAEDIGLAHATVSDDRSTIDLTLFSFSGHGPGRGNGGNAANRPCRQQDRADRYECEIARVYARAGIVYPDDPVGDAVRGDVANVFRNWLNEFEPELDLSVNNHEAWALVLSEAARWDYQAQLNDLLTDHWYAARDDLAFEGAQLEEAVFRSYTAGLDGANRNCALRQGPIDDLLSWIKLHRNADAAGVRLPPWSGLGALGPSTFCIGFKLAAAFSPADIAVGASGTFTLDIETLGDLLTTDLELALLQPEIIATPANTSLLSATGDRQALVASADVTALQAVPGDDAEGVFTIALRLFGLQADYASETVTFDITEPGATPCTGAVGPAGGPVTVAFLVEDECTPPSEITCSGDPATTTYRTDERVSILFDGTTCTLVLDADDPNDVLDIDSDESLVGWNAETGSAWSVSGVGDREQPGSYSALITRQSTGESYQLSFTVDVEDLGGGDIRITVRGVSISPATIPCSDDPATTTYRTGERIAIVFDGSSCSLVPDLSDDDDPDVALVLDTDEGQAGWNGGSGSNWSRDGVGDNEPAGSYSITVTRKATGEQFTLSFEVQVTVLGGGDVELTVRDVTISPGGAT